MVHEPLSAREVAAAVKNLSDERYGEKIKKAPRTSPLQPIIGVSQCDPERRSNSLGHCTVAVLPRIAALSRK
jgi:hypothetical protein